MIKRMTYRQMAQWALRKIEYAKTTKQYSGFRRYKQIVFWAFKRRHDPTVYKVRV